MGLHHCLPVTVFTHNPLRAFWSWPTPVSVGCLHPGGHGNWASVQVAPTLEQSSTRCPFADTIASRTLPVWQHFSEPFCKKIPSPDLLAAQPIASNRPVPHGAGAPQSYSAIWSDISNRILLNSEFSIQPYTKSKVQVHRFLFHTKIWIPYFYNKAMVRLVIYSTGRLWKWSTGILAFEILCSPGKEDLEWRRVRGGGEGSSLPG